LLAYGHAMSRGALEQAAGLPGHPCDDTVLEYRNPVNGGPAMRTLGTRLQRLRPGFEGRAQRHTGSKLFYVVEGSGRTEVAGKVHEWGPGDFLNVAPWTWHRHVNPGAAPAVLFQVNDIPVLRATGYYREETAS
jgi:gentisate 1,2-dioxygenase